MPIKDPAKRREYQRELMRKKRQGLTEVSPQLDLVSLVSPESEMLDPVSLVRPSVSPESKLLDPVSPSVSPVRPEPILVSPCQLNHYSLTELFRQATEQVQQAWKEILNQGGSNQCYNCHNSQRNHQLAIQLLEKYWKLSKKGEKSM